MFINNADNNKPCLLCNIQGCITCIDLNHCNICDINNGYFINPNDGLCYNSTSQIIPVCGDNIL